MDLKRITKTAVVGAGIMGHGIAQVLAQAGYQVALTDTNLDVLKTAPGRIRRSVDLLVKYRLLSKTEASGVLPRLKTTVRLAEAVSDADFVIEAVYEDLDAKRKVFEQLENLCRRDTILASNTSGIPITQIAEGARFPERIVGSHFFMPAQIVPLVEVICAKRSSVDTVATVYDFWKRAGKSPIVVQRDVPGFVGNRLQAALGREAMALVQAGVASAEDIDIALSRGFGLRIPATGILQQRDLAGLDLHLTIAKYLYPDLDASTEPHALLVDMVERGELGLKTGKGFHDWEGRDPEKVHSEKQEELLRILRAVKPIWEGEEE